MNGALQSWIGRVLSSLSEKTSESTMDGQENQTMDDQKIKPEFSLETQKGQA